MEQNAFDELLSPAFMARTILEIHRMIRRNVADREDLAFRKLAMRTNGETKMLTSIDHRAEADFIDALTRRFGKENIFVVGEESLFEGLDLSNRSEVCVLIDMIDGTDLLERGISNWCSAVVVFQPQLRIIEGAYVGFPDSNYLYFATRTEEGAYRVPLTEGDAIPEPLVNPKPIDRLQDASICLYSQKSGALLRLLSLSSKRRLIAWLENLRAQERMYREQRSADEVGFRFYNLAGNPMLARVLEGYVDVVLEPSGQQPHDMVAGAFIATKGGAVLGTETGAPLSMDVIAEALLRPTDTEVKYILAANPGLLREMADLLQE